MIAGEKLAAWLADRRAQEASHASVEACAGRWSGHPLMAGLERDLAAMPERKPAALLAAARRFMDSAADVEALMADLIARSRADPFFRPPFHPVSSEIHSGLLLFSGPDLMIALGVTGMDMLAAKKSVPRGATSVGFTGLLTLFRFVKAGGATLSFWEAPPIGSDFAASAAGRCRLVGRRTIADGEEIVMDGRYQSFVIEHARSDMLYFQALIRADAAPVAAEYDSRTRALVGATSTDEVASRVQMMATLLRCMGRDDAFPLLVEALNSPYFYTRWHIMRELLAMDAEAALPALRAMAAADPHLEIRDTARRTLEHFFADEEEEEAIEIEIECHA